MEHSNSSPIYLQEKVNSGQGVFTRVPILKESRILDLAGEIVEQPNRFSLQIDENRHLTQSGEIDDFINHACEPNCRVDFTDLSLVAIRDIRPGEELTINYCASEYEMAESFSCSCGSTHCYGVVRGFAFLETSDRNRLVSFLSPYLKRISVSSEE